MTNEHREQAREIAEIQNRAQEKYGNIRLGDPLEEPCPGCGCVTFAAARKDVNTLLAIISSRDADIKEVLEGLATHQIGSRRPCWCPPDYESEPHSATCLAARALYEKVSQ